MNIHFVLTMISMGALIGVVWMLGKSLKVGPAYRLLTGQLALFRAEIAALGAKEEFAATMRTIEARAGEMDVEELRAMFSKAALQQRALEEHRAAIQRQAKQVERLRQQARLFRNAA